MFNRIWLRSNGVFEDDNDDGGEREGGWEEPVRSEVLVSEVLVPGWRSGELGSGETSGPGSGSESGQTVSAKCALSSKILKKSRRKHKDEAAAGLF